LPEARRARLAALAAVLLAVSACARLPRPGAEASQVGVASWYGNEFHGRPTSSGEVFDANDLTAAHRTLPFGTYVMVTNLVNDRSVVVRINDRGPFVRGRIIDLSYAAARALGLVGPGTARVRLDILRGPAAVPPAEAGGIWVQVGAFAIQENAHKLKRELEGSYPGVAVSVLKTDRGTYYRVRIRTDEGAVQGLARRLASQGYPVIIVRE
jgi:rare lipoprotein A